LTSISVRILMEKKSNSLSVLPVPKCVKGLKKGYYTIDLTDVSVTETHEVMPIGILDFVLRIGLVLSTGFLFGIILLAYFRLRNLKMLLILVGFGIFFVHALITVPELFDEAYAVVMTENVHFLYNLIGLVFILLGILKD